MVTPNPIPVQVFSVHGVSYLEDTPHLVDVAEGLWLCRTSACAICSAKQNLMFCLKCMLLCIVHFVLDK